MQPAKIEAFFKSLIMHDMAKERAKEDWKPFLKYFPGDYSKDFKKFANDEFCKMYNYLICYTRQDRQKAFCTHCGKKVVLPKEGYHNAETVCPDCGYKGVIKHAWRKVKTIEEWGHLMHWDKADYDKKSIVCRGIYVVRRINLQGLKIDWHYHTRCYYLFKEGQCEFREHRDYYTYYNDVLFKHKNLFPIMGRCQARAVTAENVDSLYKAAQGTKWQYILPPDLRMSHICAGDSVKLLAAYDKYPQMEYLMKAGFGELVIRKIEGLKTNTIINWRAKTIRKAIKIPLTKSDVKFIRTYYEPLSFENFQLLKLMKTDNPNKPLEDCKIPEWALSWLTADTIERLHKIVGNVEKIFKYTEQQRAVRKKEDIQLLTPYSVLSDWWDYLDECRRLGLNLKDTAILMPKDLRQAHINTTVQLRAKADAELDKKIAKAKKNRKKFNFTYGGLFCRPAENTSELVAEGMKLIHCVGTYAERYANLQTHIVFIRHVDEPDEPYYTMEISIDNEIVQVRGFKNCGRTDEVKEFLEHFTADVLRKIRKGRNAA